MLKMWGQPLFCSLLLSEFAYNILARLTRPLLGSQRRCCAATLSAALHCIYHTVQYIAPCTITLLLNGVKQCFLGTLHCILLTTLLLHRVLHCTAFSSTLLLHTGGCTVCYTAPRSSQHFYCTWGEQLLGPRKLCDRDLTVVLCDAINNF